MSRGVFVYFLRRRAKCPVQKSRFCGAPVEDPQLLVLVVVNQSSVGGETFGGKVAAPAAASILKQSLVYLRISPDEHLLKAATNWKDEDIE